MYITCDLMKLDLYHLVLLNFDFKKENSEHTIIKTFT